ncbi:MAG TPA: hypothetical protein VKU80_11870 [Planctomycetota bacterium]|nr:hypothetical protein [Planctomycetota bacterium]
MTTRAPMIVFADRDLSWSREVRVQLRRRGAEVRMANTLEEALKQSADAFPELIILDDTPGSRGNWDLVEPFRKAHPDAELILLESTPPRLPRGNGQGLHFSGLKPTSPSVLLHVDESERKLIKKQL